MTNVDLKKVDCQLDEINKKISFYAVNPINADEEKKKFFASQNYNPQFTYAPYRENLGELKTILANIQTDESTIGTLLGYIRQLFVLEIEMLEQRGKLAFTEKCLKLWQAPDKKIVGRAKQILQAIPRKRRNDGKKVLTTKKVINALQVALLKYGLRGWTVREKNMIACAAVKVGEKEVLIKKNEKFSQKFLKRLVVHEIGTHVIRAENGEKQPYTLFKRGLPGYLMTEEGLAVVNEEHHGCLDPFTLKIYAGRVVAIDKALQDSFRNTYNHLRKYFTPDVAWRLTIRAKRGIADTSQPGGCTKDVVYYQGYLALKKFVAEGGDINQLYYGKIGIKDIEYVQNINGIVHPRYLPTLRYLKFFTDSFVEQFNTMVSVIYPFNLLHGKK
ncbi:DUF1704 domain-containing protein [Candidatus Woesearchaeota archaeon]|nr:DUF1704 domain-containing protein [Candidatus Woesearchaeota archaeon]